MMTIAEALEAHQGKRWEGDVPPIDKTGNPYVDTVLARCFRSLQAIDGRRDREHWLDARLMDAGLSRTVASVLKRWAIDL